MEIERENCHSSSFFMRPFKTKNIHMKTHFKNLFGRQWSFIYAGVLVGIAQILYMIGLWIGAVVQGKTPKLEPITVTTDLGRMFRGMEVFINNVFGFHTELYGKYETMIVDGVEKLVPATGGAFIPGIGWPIVGMVIGGFIVSLMEKESRHWAHYSGKALLVAFIGGALFSYGTRLAGGCTLNHLMGGVPMMNIHSLVTIIFMAIGGTMAFGIMSKLDLAKYFKHQETRAYVEKAHKGEQITYKKGYNAFKNPIYWFGMIFSIVFVVVAIIGGVFNPESLQHLKNGEMVAFSKSIDGKGWFYMGATLLAGIIGGIALAKSGFGTECCLIAVETGGVMAKKDSVFSRMGVPKITRTLMRSYVPFLGIATHWLVMLVFIVIAWIFFGINPGFEDDIKYSLTAGSFLGGLALGLGAVLMIGCEIRSYMRIGMGYLNTLVGFIGFAVGYLPFTLYYDAHKAFLANTSLVGTNGKWSEAFKVYQLFSDNPIVHKLVLVLWFAFLAWVVYFFIKKAMKNTGLQPVHLVHYNTEDIQDYIDAEAAKNNGKVNGVDAPEDVPEEFFTKKAS